MAEGGSILVFGGSGLVGSALLSEGRRRHLAIHGTYRRCPVPGLAAWDGSATEAAALVDRLQPDAVLYAAGFTNVDACELGSDEAFEQNAVVPGAVAAASRGRSFVYFSTEYVFDGHAGPYREDDPQRPLSAYARSKVAGEKCVLDAHAAALVVRTTVVYGPDPQGKSFVSQLRRRLGSGDRMRVPVDQISTPTYSVDLAARALDLVDRGASGVWHVTGPAVMDRFSFAQLAASAFQLDASLLDRTTTAELGQTAVRPLRAGLAIGKLQAVFGVDAMRDPAVALAHFATQQQLALR